MNKVSWWQVLIDPEMSWREAQQFNAAADGINSVGAQIGDVASRAARLELEVARLRTALGVLTQLLTDGGAIDKSALQYRLEAAMDALEAPPPAAAPSAVDSSTDTSTPSPLVQPVTCVGCGKSYEMRATEITPSGTMCAVCFQSSHYSKG